MTQQRVRDILAAHLSGRPKYPVRVVDVLLPLIAEVGRVRVGVTDDGQRLTFQFWKQPEFDVEVPRAGAILRSMCANIAVRSNCDATAAVYGGVGFVPGSPGLGAGFTMAMMNSMGQYWFDLAWQGNRA